MKPEALIIERTLNAPISRVWNALTDINQVRQWYFDLPEFKPESGFEFQFFGGPEDRQYLHLCKITEVVKNKKLAYTWRYDGYEGNSLVTFELFEVKIDSNSEQTRLRITHEGLETFPANNPDFAKKNFAEGWTYIAGQSLKQFVESNAQVS